MSEQIEVSVVLSGAKLGREAWLEAVESLKRRLEYDEKSKTMHFHTIGAGIIELEEVECSEVASEKASEVRFTGNVKGAWKGSAEAVGHQVDAQVSRLWLDVHELNEAAWESSSRVMVDGVVLWKSSDSYGEKKSILKSFANSFSRGLSIGVFAGAAMSAVMILAERLFTGSVESGFCFGVSCIMMMVALVLLQLSRL